MGKVTFGSSAVAMDYALLRGLAIFSARNFAAGLSESNLPGSRIVCGISWDSSSSRAHKPGVKESPAVIASLVHRTAHRLFGPSQGPCQACIDGLTASPPTQSASFNLEASVRSEARSCGRTGGGPH